MSTQRPIYDPTAQPTPDPVRLSFVEIDKQTGEFIQYEGDFEDVVNEMLDLLADRRPTLGKNPLRMTRYREKIMAGATPQVRAMNLRSLMNATGYLYAWQVIE
jgi:hypothetical protein